MKFRSFKKKTFLVAIMALLVCVVTFSVTVNAGVISNEYLKDSFDDGINLEKWQIVDDENETIGLFSSAGTLRYVNPAGAEEAIVTQDPLTKGEGVTGYEIQFDMTYLTDDWSDWFSFAFNKTTVDKGLDWGKGGYLLNRTTSMQTNNPLDSVDGSSEAGPNLSGFAEMTPDIPSVAFQNITYRLVYTIATKKLDLYYDLAGSENDLTTLRNTFTFGSLSLEEDYHFAIIGSGKGLFEIDNMIINQIKGDEKLEYLSTDFEAVEKPEKLALISEDAFSYGPSKALEFNNVDSFAKFLTAEKYIKDQNVVKNLSLSFEVQALDLVSGKATGFIYGLNNPSDDVYANGVTILYIKNIEIEGVVETVIGAVKGNGETFEQVLAEKSLGVDIVGLDPIKININLLTNGLCEVTVETVNLKFTGGSEIGYFGFTSEDSNHVLIDNFNSTTYTYHDQSQLKDLYNNFNTGYLNEEDWEIDNFRDKKPGTELPLFPSAKGIYLADGKLVYDVAGESAGFFTRQSFSDFEIRFKMSDFGIPTTPTNEDGELDGVEVPQTYFVAVSLGHTSIEENTWDVSTLIFQTRDGGAAIYALNMNDNQVKEQDPSLRFDVDPSIEWEFKVVAKGGTVKAWVKKTTDPGAIFDGQPLVTYHNVDHFGRIAIASSASGSFKIDDLSIKRLGFEVEQPAIQDEVDPNHLIAPVITINNDLPFTFEQNSDVEVDFTKYITANDNIDGDITITKEMVDQGEFDLTKAGKYTVTFTVTDSHGNQTVKTLDFEVIPAVDKKPVNVVVVAIIVAIFSIAAGSAGTYFILKKNHH